MILCKLLTRVSRSVSAHRLSSAIFSAPESLQFHVLSNQFHSIRSPDKFVTGHSSVPQLSVLNSSMFQHFGFSSSASPQPDEKENNPSKNDNINAKHNVASENADPSRAGTETSDMTGQPGLDTKSQSGKRRRVTKRTAFSDSDSEPDREPSMDDLAKLVAEKEELLKMKHKEIEKMQDKVLRSYAEMENVMDRTRREAENSKKFALQNFAKSLLDVADNLGRASSVVKESFSKIDASKDSTGAVPLLQTLLEGVEMTEKQLAEVFKKFGVEKFDPTNEQFDPNRHNAAFQVPDSSKPPGTVAVVLKAGYMLHDRVIRPADVGVTEAAANVAEQH